MTGTFDVGPFEKKLPEGLKELVLQTGAVIAGGSVLSSCVELELVGEGMQDFDIYVPQKNIGVFMEGLEGFRTVHIGTVHGAAEYCEGFMRKNGIVMRARASGAAFILDVMAVDRDPVEVVNNFDLTCCEVWYDGTSIWSRHADDIRAMVATLKPGYVDSFLSGNKFTTTRVKKYIQRGFEIRYEIKEPGTRTIKGRSRLEVTSADAWVWTTVFNTIIDCYPDALVKIPPTSGVNREYVLALAGLPEVRERYLPDRCFSESFYVDNIVPTDDDAKRFIAGVIMHICADWSRMPDRFVEMFRVVASDLVQDELFSAVLKKREMYREFERIKKVHREERARFEELFSRLPARWSPGILSDLPKMEDPQEDND